MDLKGVLPAEPITIGAGVSTWGYPMMTYYHDARTQVIYLDSEIGSAMSITALALDVSVIPLGWGDSVMSNWTIRVQHTPLSSYTNASWEGSGWTTVYQNNETITSTGWVTFDFTTPFDYNGTDNLMVDFSFNNSSYSSEGFCSCSTPGGNRSLSFRIDSDYGDPLTWSGASDPAPALYSTNVPNIRLSGEDTVAISPLVSGSFVSGVWNGDVTVLEQATGMYLNANDASGHVGDSNPFDIRRTATLQIQSAHGTAAPVPGIYTNVYNTVLTNTVSGSEINGTTQYVCTGWVMSGNAPGTGAGTNVVMTHTNDAVLTWGWTTNYYLTTATSSNGTVDVASDWQALGSNVVLTATPDTYYHFDQWAGDTNAITVANASSPTVTVTVAQPVSLMAGFAENLAPMGTPEWWLAHHGLTNASFADEELGDLDGDLMPVWGEWRSDTDPNDSNSVLRITGMSPGGSGNRIYWQGGTSAWQYLQRSADLSPGVWRAIFTNSPPTPISTNFFDVTLTNKMFYRIEAVRP